MSFTRRTFLLGAGSGLSVLLLAACTDTPPAPTPTPTLTPVPGLPEPSAFARSAWATDPFSRGAVSFTRAGSLPQQRANLGEPLAERVFFAGEAVSEAPGTVRGALLSASVVVQQLNQVAQSGERIAVVGAGIAGSETARMLSAFGYDVVVLEGRDRIGGRIHSVTDDEQSLELGAWRFWTEADEAVLRALDRLAITTVPLAQSTLYSDAPSTSLLAGADDAVTRLGPQTVLDAADWAAEQISDVSLADALEESGAVSRLGGTVTDGIPSPEVLDQYLTALSTVFGAAAGDLSSWFLPREPLVDEAVIPTAPLVDLVADGLDGLDVFLSTTVAGVSYRDDGVSLRLGTGESLTVDRVVLTVPLGVLQSDSIEFDPRLPLTHRGALNALGVGQVELVHLAFAEPFWATDATVIQVVGTDDPITTWVNLLPLTGESALLGIAGATGAEQIAEWDDATLQEAALEMLRPLLPALQTATPSE